MNSPAQPDGHGRTTVTQPQDEVGASQARPEEGQGRAANAWARTVAWGSGLRPAWKALAAFLMYQAIAFVIWVVPVFPRMTREYVAGGLQDARFYQWALTWTPWAVSHGRNPLRTGYVFAPTGVHLAWFAFVPGPALLTWPVTAVFGPLASLNLLKATAPALAAWAAYLVCHRLTHRFWPSVVGGCLFGFSAYVAGNMAFVNLSLIFPVPLLVYVVIRHVEGSLGPIAFVAGFAALLVGLFSISTELFGTAAIFGGVAYVGALAFGSGIRKRLVHTGLLVLLAASVAAVLLLPYLHDVVANAPSGPLRTPEQMAAPDLWSFVVPPPSIRLGGDVFHPVIARLTAFPIGNGLGYVGFAAIAILVCFAITERHRRSTWALLAFIGFVSLMALGPVLHVGGTVHGRLPETLLTRTPLIQSAVPARFALYSALAISVIAALWLSRATSRWAWLRWALALVAVVSLLPHGPSKAPRPLAVPAFLSSGQVDEVLRQGENVYVIPVQKGDEMLWQATADYWFELAQGYLGPLPTGLQGSPFARGLNLRKSYPEPPPAFASWTQQHGVSAVILDDEARSTYGSMLEGAGFLPVYSGEGVSVWRPTSTQTSG